MSPLESSWKFPWHTSSIKEHSLYDLVLKWTVPLAANWAENILANDSHRLQLWLDRHFECACEWWIRTHFALASQDKWLSRWFGLISQVGASKANQTACTDCRSKTQHQLVLLSSFIRGEKKFEKMSQMEDHEKWRTIISCCTKHSRGNRNGKYFAQSHK